MFLKLFVKCMHVRKYYSQLFTCPSSIHYNSHIVPRKDIIRGALTDGQDWIFIILKMKPDGDGAVYAQSKELYLVVKVIPDRKEVSRTMCSVIAGIITYWASDLDPFLCCRSY